MKPLFIEGKSGSLFSVFYPPSNTSLSKAILHIPAFAEEMNKSRRMVSLQAKKFAELGYAVLIVDLFGTGDSAGDFGEATWDIWLQDVNAAVEWLKQQGALQIDLWALRVGALLAMDFVNRGLQPIDSLICWQPVFNADMFITQFLRLRIAAAMMNPNAEQEKTSDLKRYLLNGQSIEVAGYTLNPDLILPILGLRPTEFNLSELTRLLILEVVSNENSVSLPTVKFIETFGTNNETAIAKTVTGSPFWTTQEISEVPELLAETVAFIDCQ